MKISKWFVISISVLVLISASALAITHPHRNRPGVVYWHGDMTQKKVALTFDDGPNEPYTSQILDILAQKKIHATFFLVGKNVEMYPETAKKIVEAGHAIGNHSYTHPNMIFKTDGHVRRDITMAEDAIEKATGKRPALFRPPFGGDDPLTFLQTEKLGYVAIKWSISSKDWQKPGVDKIVQRVLTHTENGSIILMHDGDKLVHGGDRSQTVAAASQIIDALLQQGYEFVTIPELLELDPFLPPVKNTP